MSFELRTYASPVDYVPDFLDNRERWKKGSDFFYVQIQPVNDSEFQLIKQGAKGSEDASDLDLSIIEKRVIAVHGLEIKSNDGSVLIPKCGADLLNGVRKQLDTNLFSKLVSDLVIAALRHSELSKGELKGSNSSSA